MKHTKSTKSLLVGRVLRKYGGLRAKPNLQAWEHFYRNAQADKVWARGVTADWLRGACDVSLKMQKDRDETPTVIIAARSYGYSYYRAHATGKAWGLSVSIDPQAAELWQGFEEATQ